ncbi:hypothetical protein OPQ81_006000 [Rhizoctonia solani]|nr:hypothetical protein OPQ81_006000 [Rhizoctonia solani]
MPPERTPKVPLDVVIKARQELMEGLHFAPKKDDDRNQPETSQSNRARPGDNRDALTVRARQCIAFIPGRRSLRS